MRFQRSRHTPRDEKRKRQRCLIQSKPSSGLRLYDCRFQHADRDGYLVRRSAFTLLELMLALGLRV